MKTTLKFAKGINVIKGGLVGEMGREFCPPSAKPVPLCFMEADMDIRKRHYDVHCDICGRTIPAGEQFSVEYVICGWERDDVEPEFACRYCKPIPTEKHESNVHPLFQRIINSHFGERKRKRKKEPNITKK